jgi:hypothetical protein
VKVVYPSPQWLVKTFIRVIGYAIDFARRYRSFVTYFLATLLLFVARMSFVFAASIFGFVFIVRRPEFQIPTFRYVIVIIALFALFCYVQELEQLGRALIGPGPRQKDG